MYKKSLAYSVARLWNSLPYHLNSVKNIPSFNSELFHLFICLQSYLSLKYPLASRTVDFQPESSVLEERSYICSIFRSYLNEYKQKIYDETRTALKMYFYVCLCYIIILVTSHVIHYLVFMSVIVSFYNSRYVLYVIRVLVLNQMCGKNER